MTPRRFSIVTACAAALVASPAVAQEHHAVTHIAQYWTAINYQGPLSGRLSLAGDVQYRGWDDMSAQAVIVRNALLYRVVEGFQIGVGYMWQPGWRSAGFTNFFDEHRVFEVVQYQWTHPRSGASFQLRTRFEQRFRYPTGRVELGLRARQLVRATVPLTTDQRLTFVAWDEVFLNLTNSGNEDFEPDAQGHTAHSPQWEFAGFDQNRAFVGLGYQLVPRVLRAELGYMNQYVRRRNNPNNGGDLDAHTALLQLFFSWH